MTYQEIKTFRQRCENKPAHPAEIQLHLHEEIAELRHFIEMRLLPKDNWAYPTNNTAA